MGQIHLTPGTTFDITDGSIVFLSEQSGYYYTLDQCQTCLFLALLLTDTLEQAAQAAKEDIDADETTIITTCEALCSQLESYGLIQRGETPVIVDKECRVDQNHTALFSSYRPAVSQPLWYQQSIPWEFFQTGSTSLSPLPSISWHSRLSALFQAASLLILFRRTQRMQWLPLIKQRLNELAIPNRTLSLEPENWQRLGRRELLWSQFLTRIFFPRGKCVPCSLGLCAYLLALGLPAQLVIGRAQFDSSDIFHAWVEIADRVINDDDVIRLGYTVLWRVPESFTQSQSLSQKKIRM
ncbi:transglutaminase superfamily protein [Thermosporothrix hazakensis]|jgi:hypothetical protein|uniref:Transglutaminase superfamily protein n=1 Tax=Thermosporothrix hazakensis TaxID=644383 RepID=A0A326TXJ4_THEHA|nr:lasso peptide biosynthesis B2 protein [Thermosporothrix hazakensis]PZW21123.1 transglutaminase superfamily protein [Thermosporothrix hazakensis]